MYIFTLVLGIILILGAVAFDFFWLSRYPWGFQALRRDRIRNLVTAAFGLSMHIGGLYLMFWSLAH